MGGGSSKTRTKAAAPSKKPRKGIPSVRLAEDTRAFEESVRRGEPRWDPDLGEERFLAAIERVYEEVRETYDLAQRRHEGLESVALWRVVKVKAQWYGARGDLEREEAEWKSALTFARDAKNPPQDLAECYQNLGRFYEERRADYVKAEAMYRSAVDEMQRGLGRSDDPRIAPVLIALPDLLVHRVQSRFSEAAFLYERVLALGPEPALRADALHGLFLCLNKSRKKRDEAARRGREAVAAFAEAFGADHPRTRFVAGVVEAWNRDVDAGTAFAYRPSAGSFDDGVGVGVGASFRSSVEPPPGVLPIRSSVEPPPGVLIGGGSA